MSLETASFISQLVATNPPDADLVQQANGHLKLIKAVLQSQFPNFTAAALVSTNANIDAAVTALGTTPASSPALIPIGGTIMWWNSTQVPYGASTEWAWCNGQTIGTTSAFAALAAACPALVSGGNVVAPDLREVVPMGRQGMGGASSRSLVSSATPSYTSAGTMGAVIGEAAHTMTTSDLVSHGHSYNGSFAVTNGSLGISNSLSISDTQSWTDSGSIANGAGALAGGYAFVATGTASALTVTRSGSVSLAGSVSLTGSVGSSGSISVASTGSGNPMNITQPTCPVNWVIRIA